MRTPNSYERAALREIAAFRAEVFPTVPTAERPPEPKSPAREKNGFFVRARAGILAGLSAPLTKALDEASTLTNPERVAATFREAGYAGVSSAADVQHLSLHEVDRVAASLRRKHAIAAALAGATAGVFGGIGALIEAPAIATLALRAIVECALHYGYDVSDDKERAFVLDVLAVAVGPSPAARRTALEHATGLIWPASSTSDPPSTGGVAARVLARRGAQAVFSHLARTRFGKAAPAITAAVGAALNARFLYRVVTVASLLYRERFLIRRCGPAMVALCEAGVEMAPGTTFGHHPYAPHSGGPLALS